MSSKEARDIRLGEFNQAIIQRNYYNNEISRVGKTFIKFLDEELENPQISSFLKDTYREDLRNVKWHLDKLNANNVNSVGGAETTASRRQWFSSEVPNLNMNDIKGLQEVKDEFNVNVLAPFLEKYSQIYKKYRGDKLGSQILLYGPPGTGKTFMVKCLAGQLNCHIAVVQTKDILANLVGDAEKNMAEVFEEAEQYDRCIIFFDEIDAIAASRESEESRHTKGVLTTMLTYMDGFTRKVEEGKQRIIIAATNRPWVLDSAIKRGGRFETQIHIPIPDSQARFKLVERAFGKDETEKGRIEIPCAKDFLITWLAEELEGMSGADINAVCKQIITRPMQREILSLHDNNEVRSEVVTREDCEEVIKNYINGITNEMLVQFDAYSKGLEINEYIKIMKDKIKSGEHIPDYALKFVEN